MLRREIVIKMPSFMMTKTKVLLLVVSALLPAISLALQSLYVRPSHQLYTGGSTINGSWKMMPDEPMPEVCFFCAVRV
jgi:hypothetical protein